MRFEVLIYQDEDGAFIAECPIIPGCISQGSSMEEAQHNITEAIHECLQVRKELGLPPIVYRTQVEVPV